MRQDPGRLQGKVGRVGNGKDRNTGHDVLS